MRILKPQVTIFRDKNGIDICKSIEKYGRVCYRSEGKITDNSYEKFLPGAIKRGHFSIIEHEKSTVQIVCDRGVTHELVRHRIGSYSQESTRYVNYKNGIDVIEPIFWPENKSKENGTYKFLMWRDAMLAAERFYIDLITNGAKPEEARSVLPNSLKTEIIVTFNLREWRHFFFLRGSPGAHIQIRQIACMILEKMQDYIPIIFDDLKIIDKEKYLITTGILPAS